MFDAKLPPKVRQRQAREAGAAARQARFTKDELDMTAASSTAVLESGSDEDRDTDEPAAPLAEESARRLAPQPSFHLSSLADQVLFHWLH